MKMLIENIDKVPVSVALCTLGRIVICFLFSNLAQFFKSLCCLVCSAYVICVFSYFDAIIFRSRKLCGS